MTFLGIFGSTFFDTVRSQLSKIDYFGFAVKNAIFDTPIFDTVRNGLRVIYIIMYRQQKDRQKDRQTE